jgi:hypothetical protein
MKNLIQTLVLLGTAVADPCTDLCSRDGPSVCTGGSWTKSNGYCHGYVFKRDPSTKEYCYHSKATADSCPTTGKQFVKASDVADLLNSDVLMNLLASASEISVFNGETEETSSRWMVFDGLPQSMRYEQIVRGLSNNGQRGLVRSLFDLEGVVRSPVDNAIHFTRPGHLQQDGAVSVICASYSDHFFVGMYRIREYRIPSPEHVWFERLCSLMYELYTEIQTEERNLRLGIQEN